jgi:hypothetical protein
MNSKIQVYEKIQHIIDEEIKKAKSVILERCGSLFDELLSNSNNMNMNENENIKLSLEETGEPVEQAETDANADNFSIDDIEGDDDADDETEDINNNIDSDEDDSEVPVYEIEINNEMYYVSDEDPNFIFEKMEDDTVGDCVGIYSNDTPFFLTYFNGDRCYLNVNTGVYYQYISPVLIGEEL